MHSRLLRHFLGVVEKRNITAAAEALHISQPALTRSIRQLEKTIGVPLFERLPTGVALTKQGEVLARRVKLMELEYRHALSEISALEQGVTGTLRIGAGPMWISTLLPGHCHRLSSAISESQSPPDRRRIDSIVPALLAGEIDLACVTLSFPSQPELVKEPLVNVRQALVARAGHPLAGKGTVKAEDLARFPWLVLANDSVGTSRVGSYLVANGLDPPKIAVEASLIGMLRPARARRFSRPISHAHGRLRQALRPGHDHARRHILGCGGRPCLYAHQPAGADGRKLQIDGAGGGFRMTALAPAGGSAAVIPFVYAAAPSMNWPASRRPDTLQDVFKTCFKTCRKACRSGAAR